MIARYDTALYDARLLLCEDHRRGIWAADLQLLNTKSNWTAGQMPREASGHSLLVAGLTASLSKITRSQTIEMVLNAGRKHPKPRFQIVTTDGTFADALQSKMQGVTGKPLRSTKSLLMPLAQQLARFSVSFAYEPENYRILALRNWAVKTVHNPTIPPSLAPVAASTLVNF